MTRNWVLFPVIALAAGCDSPASRNPGLFEPSPYVADAPVPQILPLSALALPAGTEPEAVEELKLSAAETAIRAEALRARAILQSGAVLTPEERARLTAASARWTGP
jgi:hypothetical protein